MNDLQRLVEIESKLERVKAAHRDNEIDVFNPEHHASLDDVAWLARELRALVSAEPPDQETQTKSIKT